MSLDYTHQLKSGRPVYRIPLEDINIRDRQRKILKDIPSLAFSIDTTGLINPITVFLEDEKLYLIAGMRRYEAHKHLRLKTIEASLLTDLTKTQQRLIELEENYQRSELVWHEELLELAEMFDLKKLEFSQIKIPGRFNGRYTISDLAHDLNRAESRVYADLALVGGIKSYPDLKDCDNKTDAARAYRKMENTPSKRSEKSRYRMSESLAFSENILEVMEKIQPSTINCILYEARSFDNLNTISAELYKEFFRVLKVPGYLVTFTTFPETYLMETASREFSTDLEPHIWIYNNKALPFYLSKKLNSPEKELPNIFHLKKWMPKFVFEKPYRIYSEIITALCPRDGTILSPYTYDPNILKVASDHQRSIIAVCNNELITREIKAAL